MAIANAPWSILVPSAPALQPGNFYSATLNADAEWACVVFRVPKTGTISKVGFRVHTVAQCTNGLKFGLKTVDATNGNPNTGTDYGGSAEGTRATPSAATWYWESLGTAATAATKGDICALCVAINNFQTGDSLTISNSYGGMLPPSGAAGFPYRNDYVDGAWAKESRVPVMGLEYSDNTFGEVEGVLPIAAATYRTITNTGVDRAGLRFRSGVPFRARGCQVYATTAEFSVYLYDSNGTTLLENILADYDIRGSGSSPYYHIPFSQSRTFLKDTYYRLVLLGTSGGVRLQAIDVTDDGAYAAMAAVPGGVDFHGTYCSGVPANEAAWTQETTRRYGIMLVADGFDDGVSGGSSAKIIGG